MDGISNLVGDRESTIKIGDKTYTLTTHTLHDYASRERYILGRRPDETKLLENKNLSPQAVEAIVREATRAKFVSFEEDNRFEQSIHGVCYRLWQALKHHHGEEITDPYKAYALVVAYGMNRVSEIKDKLDEVEEKTILGNSSSPETPGTVKTLDQTSDASPGPSSSAS